MKLHKGDIFEFTINNGRFCYGQIINVLEKKAITIIIFEGIYKSRPVVEELFSNAILFFGNTFDAKLYHKDWIIFDNYMENINSIVLPFYKVGIDPVYIEDFFKKTIRQAKSFEADVLYFRSYVAPVRFESAVKAYYKLIEWDDVFDELLYSNILLRTESISI